MSNNLQIEANGLKFNVLVEGEGRPLLLLHGFPDSANMWKHITPQLVQKGFKVIAYDQRGYGDSDAPTRVESYAIKNIISDAVAILKALGYSSGVQLVGHDWGAVIGWQLCLAYPELIERYVAVSVGHPLAYRHAGLRQRLKGWYILAFQIPDLAENMIRANDWASLRKMAGSDDERSEQIVALSRPGRLTAAINWYRANFFGIMFGKFKKCRVPTMGVYSSNDVALTENQMTDSAKYMDAEWKYVRIENSSHWIPLDRPAELAEQICGWMQV